MPLKNRVAETLVILGIFVAPCLSVGSAQAASEPMTFSLWRADYRPRAGLVQAVYADGTIEPGTAERFKDFLKANKLEPGGTVYLNSPGGSLVE